MKKLLMSILLTALTSLAFSQTYISFSPSIFNAPGTFTDKLSGSLEVGRTWGPFSLGVDVGSTSFKEVSKNTFVELRPTLSYTQGKFSAPITLGLGYMSGNRMLTELTTGIQYTPNNKHFFGINVGDYWISDKYDSEDFTWIGFTIGMYLNNSNK